MFDQVSPRRSALIGLLALVVTLGSVLVSFEVHLGLPGENFTLARFSFPELNNLRQTNQVNIGGVRVGQVREVEYRDGRAVVTAQMDPGITIYRDATAGIENRSPLGQKVLEIEVGTPAAGELGDDVLAMPADAVNTELDRVLGALDADSRAALASTVREFGTGTAGRGSELNDFLAASPDLAADLGDLARALSADEQALVALLASTQSLASRFEGRTDELDALLGDTRATLDAVTVDGGRALRQALDRLPATLDAAAPALAALGSVSHDTRVALEDLAPGTRALGDATADTRGLLRESVTPLSRIPGVADEAEPAVRALIPVVADARPLAPRAARALGDAVRPTDVLGPRHQDIAEWFKRFGDILDYGDADGNNVRIITIGHPAAVGIGPSPELLGAGHGVYTCLDPYPEPGSTLDQGGNIPLEGCE